ncbi:hypothetical protein BGZ80_007720 [Entomortierella chlamydospora]|uniref:Uncharacterized protein n=1 Tax=Entomortierella chlamydospora TaxID=101097 RepID=A0A9P6N545_9FUNG|nr:hypothetical protein BGZ80_007720 [Entomortierella chlamydospora]
MSQDDSPVTSVGHGSSPDAGQDNAPAAGLNGTLDHRRDDDPENDVYNNTVSVLPITAIPRLQRDLDRVENDDLKNDVNDVSAIPIGSSICDGTESQPSILVDVTQKYLIEHVQMLEGDIDRLRRRVRSMERILNDHGTALSNIRKTIEVGKARKGNEERKKKKVRIE